MHDAPADRPEVAHLEVADPARALGDRLEARACERIAASVAQVVSGPMCTAPSRSSTPRSSSREMSTTSDGRAIRSFITGMSDWPPAIAFASGSASSSSAWSTSDARS